MHVPGAQQVIRVREADVAALVGGEVQVVPPETLRRPVGNADERRPLDVRPEARIQIGADDRPIEQTLDMYGCAIGLTRIRRERRQSTNQRYRERRDVSTRDHPSPLAPAESSAAGCTAAHHTTCHAPLARRV